MVQITATLNCIEIMLKYIQLSEYYFLFSRMFCNEYTASQKNIPPLTCYNPDTHNPITLIFGRSVTEKVKNQMTLCFPTSPL